MESNNLLQAFRLNFLYAEKYSFPNQWTYYESVIPYSMIRFIEKGKARFIIDDTSYELVENDIVYIPQGSQLHCEAFSDDFTFISIRFTATIALGDIEVWSEIMGFDTLVKCHDDLIKYYFGSIIQEKDSSLKGRYFTLRGYLELIVGYLINSSEAIFNRVDKPRTIKLNNKNDNRVQITLDYMLNNYKRNISVEELSEMVNISSTTLRRLFKQDTGKSPSEFLIQLKMTEAAKKILETDERISDIAYMVGIEDPNYFSRTFKKHFGVTPYTYRQRVRGL
ncbi:cupin domain-containing protein [Paenibacillus sp. CMAA1364]